MIWTRFHSIVVAALFFVGLGFWAANNIVFASDYNRYQTQQEIRWMQYDERMLYQEYRDMVRLSSKTDAERRRLADIEHEMSILRDRIKAARSN